VKASGNRVQATGGLLSPHVDSNAAGGWKTLDFALRLAPFGEKLTAEA
jgi:hypothetical protein